MTAFPRAYHITFGTYGTRLHGDERGTIDRTHNQFGDPILGIDRDWHRIEQSSLRFDPALLDHEQCLFIEQAIPAICERGGWTYHVAAGRTDHVHTLLSAQADGKTVRRLLKRWLTQATTERWSRPPGAPWWAEGGSVKWIWDDAYFDNVYTYITGQRITAT